jgi:hypothetical protein
LNESISTHPATPEEEKTYISSLSSREAVFVAQGASQVVGFQTFDLWARYLSSMDHVGQLGTFVRREWRGHGIAGNSRNALWHSLGRIGMRS